MARALFTDRHGGVSTGAFRDFNLALHVGDNPTSVVENRNILARSLGVDPAQVFYMNQVHGKDVATITSASDSTNPASVDALFTTEPGLALVVLTADCIPLLMYSKGAIAAVHVGRKGLVAGIATEVIDLFAEQNISADQISAELGASICGGCYEVEMEMYRDVVAQIPATATDEERHCLDLVSGLHSQLESAGIRSVISTRCTFEDDNYFSYRRDDRTGRQGSVVML